MTSTLRGTTRRTITLSLQTAGAQTVVQYASNFVLAPVVFATAGSATFGAWATVSSILAVGALGDAGLRLEISRRVAEAAGEDNPERLKQAVRAGTTILAWVSLAVFVLGLVLAPAIRSFAFPNGLLDMSPSESDWLLRATLSLLAISLLADGYFAVLRGVQRADVENLGRMLGIVAGTAVSMTALWLGWGIWGLFAGAATIDAVAIVVQAIGVRRVVPEVRFRVGLLRSTAWRSMLALSTLALVSQISDVIDSQWDKVVLSRYVGSSAVASFQLGTMLAFQAKMLALLPAGLLLVTIAELRTREPDRVGPIVRMLSSMAFALGALALSGVVVFAPPFLRLWIGEDLPDAVVAARLFSVALAINLIAAPLAYRALAERRHVRTSIASGCNIAVNIVASYALTLVVGFRGPLWGSIAGNACGTLVFFVLMASSVERGEYTRAWRVALIAIVATAIALLTDVDDISSWVGLLVAVAIYCAVVGPLLCWAERIPVRTLLRRGVAAAQ